MLREFMEFSKFLSGNERRYLHSGAKFCPVKYEINLSQVQYIYIIMYIYIYMYMYIYATFTSKLIYTYIAKSLGTALQHFPSISPLLIEWLVLYPMFVGELCVSSLPSCLGFLCPYIPNNSQATKVAT